MGWKDTATRHLRAVPKGSPRSAYAAALKAASREYRGRSGGSSGGGTRRRNPNIRLGDPKTIAILLVAGYLAYTQFILPNQKPATAPAATSGCRTCPGSSNYLEGGGTAW